MLPNGTGKTVRVAVFAQGPNADAARAAGADIVGMDDLGDQVKKGELNFDVVIASPDAMRVVGQLGQILGPRGLMPNPKVGTVTPDVATAVKNAKAGQVRYRTDKAGIIHCTIGKISFDADAIQGKPGSVAGRPEESQASNIEGHLHEENYRYRPPWVLACGWTKAVFQAKDCKDFGLPVTTVTVKDRRCCINLISCADGSWNLTNWGKGP